MKENFASSSTFPKNSLLSPKSSSTLRDKNNTQLQQEVVIQNSADQTNTDQENQPYSEVSRKEKEIDIGMDVNPALNKESGNTVPSDNNANTSHYANSSDEIIEEDDDVNFLDVSKLKAAVPFADIIKENET